MKKNNERSVKARAVKERQKAREYDPTADGAGFIDPRIILSAYLTGLIGHKEAMLSWMFWQHVQLSRKGLPFCHSVEMIASLFGVSYSTAWNVIKDHGMFERKGGNGKRSRPWRFVCGDGLSDTNWSFLVSPNGESKPEDLLSPSGEALVSPNGESKPVLVSPNGEAPLQGNSGYTEGSETEHARTGGRETDDEGAEGQALAVPSRLSEEVSRLVEDAEAAIPDNPTFEDLCIAMSSMGIHLAISRLSGFIREADIEDGLSKAIGFMSDEDANLAISASLRLSHASDGDAGRPAAGRLLARLEGKVGDGDAKRIASEAVPVGEAARWACLVLEGKASLDGQDGGMDPLALGDPAGSNKEEL